MTITLTHEEAQQVLDALELVTDLTNHDDELYEAIETLRARLSAPEPKPVMLMDAPLLLNGQPLYTAPPQREWQGLTDEEIGDIIESSQITLKNYCSEDKQTEYARAIEAKLREKNASHI
jgi:hypothetical protein